MNESKSLERIAEELGVNFYDFYTRLYTSIKVKKDERERILNKLESEYPAITTWQGWPALKEGK